MTEDSLGSISLFFQQLKAGDPLATRHLWHRYFPRLSGLARRVLSTGNTPQEADDAVQEAFFRFFQSIQRGDHDHALRRDDLWRLLSVMTVRAARKMIMRESAQKRGGGRVYVSTDAAGETSGVDVLHHFCVSVSTAECDAICAEFLERLDDELREIALLRLAGYSNPQIKSSMGCSLRSVERRLQLIRATWAEYDA